MNHRTHVVAALFLAAGALAAAATGCELIAQVDRNQVPGSGGAKGVGGGGTTSGLGGMGGARATTGGGMGGARTTTGGGMGGGMTTGGGMGGGTTTGGGMGGAGGSCPGGASACKAPADCPAPASDCVGNTCAKGCCGTANLPVGQICASAGGTVCDGNGACVACVAPTDCLAQPSACVVNTCAGNACGTMNAAASTACSDGGGTVCDGNGKCVGCVVAADCPVTGTLCATPSCSMAGACGVVDAAKGTACSDNGGLACDGAGKCVVMHCADKVKDADETDVDCGGATCGPCAAGLACAAPGDCVDKVCTQKVCAAHACNDLVQNGDETDVDCGGSCPKCADTKHCKLNVDCVDGKCFGNNPGVCVQCTTPADCPATGNECVAATCSGNACGTMNLDQSHALAMQTPGDCQKKVCDGAGATTSVDDPSDLPATSEICLTMPACSGHPLAPSFTQQPEGTPCAAEEPQGSRKHVCGTPNTNVGGTCVECNSIDDCANDGGTCGNNTCP